jgi:hypothetical protein
MCSIPSSFCQGWSWLIKEPLMEENALSTIVLVLDLVSLGLTLYLLLK